MGRTYGVPSSYYGTRTSAPWVLPRVLQVLATLHCGRVGHRYGEREPLVEGRGPTAQVGSIRHCAHGCGCAVVEVTHR